MNSSLQLGYKTIVKVAGNVSKGLRDKIDECSLNYPLVFVNVAIPELDKQHQLKAWYMSFRFLDVINFLRDSYDMMILDADGIIRNFIDWSDFRGSIGIYFRNNDRECMKVLAGCVYLKNDDIGTSFINEVSSELNNNRFVYWCDQLALWRTLNRGYLDNCFHIPYKYIDYELNDESIIWTGRSNVKDSDRFMEEIKKFNFPVEVE